MIIGIDIGGTNTHGVLMEGRKIISVCTIDGNETAHAIRCYKFLEKKSGNRKAEVVLTGGGSRRVTKKNFPAVFRTVGEIEAIGRGGIFLSGKKDIFVVSIGTGTAFVSVKKGKAEHVGGTGVGGGTIHGLSGLMLGMSLNDVEKIAKKSRSNLDLTVKDIVGGGLGKIPADATASNFGKATSASGKGEIASSLLNMIGEAIGTVSYFAAKSVGQDMGILVCGRVAINSVVKKRVMETIAMFGGTARIPEHAEYCAAIGAAISE